MTQYKSTKTFRGFSTVFRQWKAEGTHCKYLHGYDVYFKVTYQGELDDRNWVFDFGGFKRAINKIEGKNPADWLNWLLDHTMIIAEDDPFLESFRRMDEQRVVQLRVLPNVGAERFAEYLYSKLNPFVMSESGGRVKITSIEFFENENNSAIYEADSDTE